MLIAGSRAVGGFWRVQAELPVDQSFRNGRGEYGIGWMMMLAVPGEPETYARFMPMLARMFERAALKMPERHAAARSDMLTTWWKIAGASGSRRL